MIVALIYIILVHNSIQLVYVVCFIVMFATVRLQIETKFVLLFQMITKFSTNKRNAKATSLHLTSLFVLHLDSAMKWIILEMVMHVVEEGDLFFGQF